MCRRPGRETSDVDAAYRKLLRTSIDELVEIAVVPDEPVDGEYALALVKLGHCSQESASCMRAALRSLLARSSGR